MKILWFTNSPCGSIRRNTANLFTGGWLISLEDEVKKYTSIDLSVAFLSDKNEKPFIFDGVSYFPIFVPSRKTKIGHILDRHRKPQTLDSLLLPLMLDIVKNVNPDLIHIHGTERSFGLVQKYVNNIPIVFSIQGLLAPYTEKFFSGIPYSEVEKREKIIDRIKGIDDRRLYDSFCYRGKRECNFLKNAKYVMGRTSWDANVTGLLNPSRKYFVVNEILRKPFYVKKWDKAKFGKTFKITSIISPGLYKGLETLLKTASLLKIYSGVNFEWNVIGLSPKDEYVTLCEDFAHVKSNDVNVHYLGLQAAEPLSQILVESDIYCHVSHIENSPNSVCEAMLLGMPVVATFAGGTSSILQDGEEGFLVQDGDPYSLAGTILKMHQTFDSCRLLGLNAMRRATNRHKPENVAEELIQSYNKILTLYGTD